MEKYRNILWTIFALVFLVFIIPPVLAIEYGGIGGRPAFPRSDNVRSESIFIHEISPGETIDEGIKVVNNTSETKTLLIYATDETPSTDGGFACKQFSELNTGVGNWITLKKKEVTLKSLTSEVIPFTITAPEDVDVGEYNGCIVVQEKKDKTDEAGLKLSFRTGIRVALTIPGEIIRLLEISGFKIVDKDVNTYVLTPTIKNSGNTSIDANIKVIVINLITQEKIEFGGNYTVLRNNPLVLNFDFPKPFWGGKYLAKTTVIYNDGTNESTLESQAIEFTSWPQKQALIYLGLALLLIIFFTTIILVLRWRKNKKLKSWRDYTVKKGDTLSKIIKNRNALWKEIVSVNKIKPPYELKIGQIIKVPQTK